MVVPGRKNTDSDHWFLLKDRRKKNIGILRMTGEVAARFNGITLFGMVLFWQKAIKFSQTL